MMKIWAQNRKIVVSRNSHIGHGSGLTGKTEIRVDNQPIPPEERDKLISELKEIMKALYTAQGQAPRVSFDDVTQSRI